MPTAFQKLIIKYAGNKKICNCGNAYEKPCGEGFINGEYRTDVSICEYGCSANQDMAREYVAEEVLGLKVKKEE